MDAQATTRIATPEFELYCEDYPDSQWFVAHVTLEERINHPYQAEIELWSDSDDSTSFLGASCELVLLRDAERRRLYGLVSEVEALGESDHHFGVRLVLVPAFTLLGQGCKSRIWQQQSVQDILAELLNAELSSYGRTFDLAGISRGLAPREYCVQYQESAATFASRLLAEEGINYRFDHSEATAHELLECHDDQQMWSELENVDGSSEIPVITDRPEQANVESVQTLAPIRRLTPSAALRRDFDWTRPLELLTNDAGGSDERGRTRRVYAHGERRFAVDDLDERVDDQLEAELREATLIRGTSNVMSFAPGLRFYLASHDRPELEGEYVLTRVSHEGTHAETDGSYKNVFDCAPAEVPLRPRARPRPQIHGPQTAIVVGDDEVHTDEHGRIQVQFHWEEAPSYASDASCWVRCAQAWAGPGWGAQFIPRVGMEVVVEFLDGNPDRPLVTGCVYNGDNNSPFRLPEDKTQSGWRTSSSPGGEGYNMIRFEDAAGAEEIHIHGQRDWSIIIENNKAQLVCHDESLDVTHDRYKHIGNDEREVIDRDRSIKVGNNHDETIGASQAVSVGTHRSEMVGLTATESVGATKTVSVVAAYTLTAGTVSVGVGGTASETVGASKSVTVLGDSSESISGSKSLTAKSLTQDAQTDMTVSVGKKLQMSAGDDLSIKGKKKALIDVADKLVLRCGKASITLKKNGDIQIKGKNIALEGKGDIKIKGKKVVNN